MNKKICIHKFKNKMKFLKVEVNQLKGNNKNLTEQIKDIKINKGENNPEKKE